jgi:hypothetical protein
MKANYEKPKRDKELDNIAFKKCKRGGYTMISIDLAKGKDWTAEVRKAK